jgi:hypothetical protein
MLGWSGVASGVGEAGVATGAGKPVDGVP